MQARNVVFGLLGTVSTGFGLAVLAIPERIRSVGPLAQVLDAVDQLDPTALMLAAGLLVAGYVSLVARSRPNAETVSTRSDAERRFETAETSPPEGVSANRQTITAAALDADIEAAIENGGIELTELAGELETLATSAYASATGHPPETAREAVREGTWTSDPVAAAFLSSTDEPAPTVRSRIALWLRPRRERKQRIERTIVEIERLQVEA